MAHRRETLLAAIVTQIKNASTGVGTKVYRGRRIAVEDAELPACLVYQGDEASRFNDVGADLKWRALQVLVSIQASSEPTTINNPDIETVLNGIAEGVENALEGDFTFGGNALKFEHVATETNVEAGEVDRGELRLVLEVQYRTARTAAGT